jgi:hypothetical protein
MDFSMNWLKQRKIAWLSNTKRTADVCLAQTLEKANAGRIKSVYIGIQWDDDTFVGDWSQMPLRDLLMHAKRCEAEADSVFRTGQPLE